MMRLRQQGEAYSAIVKREIDALREIRNRWRLRGWKFNPLASLCTGLGDGVCDGLDDSNEAILSLYALKDSPLCWASIELFLWDACSWSGSKPETLIDELVTLYRGALQPWEYFKTVFDCEESQRDRDRWRPYGTYPARLRREAANRFWELKTTSRYSVANAVPSLAELRLVNHSGGQIEDQHLVSLAVMVCVVRAIESLENILIDWCSEAAPYLKGCSFDWVAQNDNDGLLEYVLLDLVLKDEPGNRAFFVSKMSDAAKYQHQAQAWISFADELFTQGQKLERAVGATRQETLSALAALRKRQAKEAAKQPRKGLTAEVVAEYWNANPSMSRQKRVFELSQMHSVSERTVERHLKTAKEKNLLT